MSEDDWRVGPDAERCSHVRYRVIRSVKMELLRPDLGAPANDPGSYSGLERAAAVPEFVAAVFLSEVIRRSASLLSPMFEAVTPDEFNINMVIPVDQLGQDHAEARFRSALDTAVRLAAMPDVPTDLASLWELWRTEKRRVAEIPPEERSATLVPESQAIIEGAAETTQLEDDRFKAVVDIGAGTTDVAWFKFSGRRGSHRKLPFFASQTKTLGCDALDDHILDNLGSTAEESPRAFAELRGGRPALLAGKSIEVQVNGHSQTVDPELLSASIQDVLPSMYAHYRGVFGAAYEKHRFEKDWEDLGILITGGGSLLPHVRDAFKKHPNRNERLRHVKVDVIDVAAPPELTCVGASNQVPVAVELPFLLTALGLAQPAIGMRIPIAPGGITPTVRPLGEPTGPYVYQAPDDD